MGVKDYREGSRYGSDISENSSTQNYSMNDALAEYEKQKAEKQRQAVKELVEYKHKLELANIPEGSKEYLQLLANFQKQQQKQKLKEGLELEKELQKQRLKNLTDYYKTYKSDEIELQKDKAELAKTALGTSISAFFSGDKATAKEAKKEFKENSKELMNELGTNLLKELVNKTINEVNTAINTYSKYEAGINARLQGRNGNIRNNYWGIEHVLTTTSGINPYIKNTQLLENLNTLVDKGIAYNVEQRAFLETVSDNIATTFSAFDSNLLRIIRIQQSDSTAARLGLEASLTRYFNSAYEDTSYLSDVFDSVSGSLLEASSTMSNDLAVSFEYQVQKWLGSLYSVGMSQSSIQNIAQALGYLGSGNVSALSSSSMQNLLVMAASRAGLSYSNLLTGGLNAESTNILLASMTQYLKEIAGGTNQVVKSQLAQTFGVTLSDINSALNLTQQDVENISKQTMTYSSAIDELNLQMQQIPARLSYSSMLQNLWDNTMYSLGSSIAGNPALYALWKVTDLIKDTTEGINIPYIPVLGTGVNLNTNLDNLLKLGVVGAGSLGLIGDIISGLSSTFVPSHMLQKLGIGWSPTYTSRGTGITSVSSGLSESMSTFIGNSDSSIYSESALAEANASAEAQLDVQQDEKTTVDYIKDDTSEIVTTLQAIRDIINDVASPVGQNVLRVKITN